MIAEAKMLLVFFLGVTEYGVMGKVMAIG